VPARIEAFASDGITSVRPPLIEFSVIAFDSSSWVNTAYSGPLIVDSFASP
jgi:hypothetical protein